MSKAEAIKEKLAKYRELLKATIWMIMAILTGIATNGKNLWDTMEKLEKDLKYA